MSLLWMDYAEEFQSLVDAAFQCEKDGTSECLVARSPRVEKIIRRDTRYNVDFLYTSYVLNDDLVMSRYASWLLTLMRGVLRGRATDDEVASYVVDHFEFIREGARRTLDAGKLPQIERLVTCAQESVRAASNVAPEESMPPMGAQGEHRYEAEIEQYLDSLFARDIHKAMRLIKGFLGQGIPVNDIYVDILAESMRRIGELWHESKITVDVEHYCTSATQTTMTQLYLDIFSSKRRGKTILCACPGAELHEMGARMVADIFENDGWDSIYLGAAVPEDYLLSAIEENEPDLVALSVTMPQFLIDCEAAVHAIRQDFPELTIAVGGGAFADTHDIWKRWPVDLYTADARELLNRANELAGA